MELSKLTVVFVGVHNKPNKLPLDSTTLSGRTIDGIIAELHVPYEKMNLFNVDYMPTNLDEATQLTGDFMQRLDAIEGEKIVVLLGGIVHNWLRKMIYQPICIAHPSLQYSKVKRPDYIKENAKIIKSAITKHFQAA